MGRWKGIEHGVQKKSMHGMAWYDGGVEMDR